MRDALSITDQAVAYGGGGLLHSDVVAMLGLVGRDEIGALLRALADGKADGVLAVSAELAERSVDFEALLATLLAELHRAAVALAVEGEKADVLFGPELVQLYYQIALAGYRDMQIVPDPRSGFEMTLLRMLAFTPETLPQKSGSRPQGPTPRIEEPPTSSAAPAQSLSAGPETPLADGTPWHAVVESLQLSGVAQMIAEHTVVLADEDGTLELVLDDAHDTLLNDAQSAAIQRALVAHLKKDIRVRIAPGVVQGETPAQRRTRLHEQRQQAAQQVLESDHTVQSLISEFGGKLHAVTPVEEEKR